MANSDDYLNFGKQVLQIETEAIQALEKRLDESFLNAVKLIQECQGHIVVTGMGKAGLIGQKISATMASTGTPAFDLHPGEALHGDLGRIRSGDVVIALSNSGKTREVIELIDPLKRNGNTVIAITGRLDTALAQNADVVLHIGNLVEACPLKLAPSTSTTAMLALGDALALTVQKARNFTSREYAKFHPAGALGRKLMTVAEVMRKADQAPIVNENDTVQQAIAATTKSRAGAISIVNNDGVLVGIFTDGDLRRRMASMDNILKRSMSEVMTSNPKTIRPERLASEASRILKDYSIDELPVVNEHGAPVGMIDVQDLLTLK